MASCIGTLRVFSFNSHDNPVIQIIQLAATIITGLAGWEVDLQVAKPGECSWCSAELQWRTSAAHTSAPGLKPCYSIPNPTSGHCTFYDTSDKVVQVQGFCHLWMRSNCGYRLFDLAWNSQCWLLWNWRSESADEVLCLCLSDKMINTIKSQVKPWKTEQNKNQVVSLVLNCYSISNQNMLEKRISS